MENQISRNSHLRDASFSSYLTTTHDASPKDSVQFHNPDMEIKTEPEENEIGVFGAEKYFNMKLDNEGPRTIDAVGRGKEARADLRRIRSKGSSIGAPSVSSESSWNSQTALLPNPSQTRQRRVNERWYFLALACNGVCSDKKSVYTDTPAANDSHRGIRRREPGKEGAEFPRSIVATEVRKHPGTRFQERNEVLSTKMSKQYFVLPTVNSGVQAMEANKELDKTKEEDPRLSLEVFGSNTIKKEDIAKNLERKLSLLTWDAIPKDQNIVATPKSNQVYEDIDSDASSDLFEIENISNERCSKPVFAKQAADTVSCYAPSEASVEWSVVTARAVDYNEKKLTENNTRNGQSSGLLSGCKSLKSVEVSETVYRRNEKLYKSQQHSRTASSMQ